MSWIDGRSHNVRGVNMPMASSRIKSFLMGAWEEGSDDRPPGLHREWSEVRR